MEWDENSTVFSVIWLMLQQLWDLNDKYLKKGTNLKTIERLRVMFMANSKHEFVPPNQVFPLLVITVLYLYKKVSCLMPVLSITIVSSCFYLLIFYFEKFSTWIWHLPFAISLTLNLSKYNNKIYHQVKRKNHHISQLLCKHTTYLLKLVIIASNPNKIFPQCSVLISSLRYFNT